MYTKKRIIGLVILAIAWELLAYSTSDYFFPEKVYEEVRVFGQANQMQWVDYFNMDLFQSLNIVGLALVLTVIGYGLFESKQKSRQ